MKPLFSQAERDRRREACRAHGLVIHTLHLPIDNTSTRPRSMNAMTPPALAPEAPPPDPAAMRKLEAIANVLGVPPGDLAALATAFADLVEPRQQALRTLTARQRQVAWATKIDPLRYAQTLRAMTESDRRRTR